MLAIVIGNRVWAGKHTTCNRWTVSSRFGTDTVQTEVIRDVIRDNLYFNRRVVYRLQNVNGRTI